MAQGSVRGLNGSPDRRRQCGAPSSATEVVGDGRRRTRRSPGSRTPHGPRPLPGGGLGGVEAERPGPVAEAEVEVDGHAQDRGAVVAVARHERRRSRARRRPRASGVEGPARRGGRRARPRRGCRRAPRPRRVPRRLRASSDPGSSSASSDRVAAHSRTAGSDDTTTTGSAPAASTTASAHRRARASRARVGEVTGEADLAQRERPDRDRDTGSGGREPGRRHRLVTTVHVCYRAWGRRHPWHRWRSSEPARGAPRSPRSRARTPAPSSGLVTRGCSDDIDDAPSQRGVPPRHRAARARCGRRPTSPARAPDADVVVMAVPSHGFRDVLAARRTGDRPRRAGRERGQGRRARHVAPDDRGRARRAAGPRPGAGRDAHRAEPRPRDRRGAAGRDGRRVPRRRRPRSRSSSSS